MSGIVRFTSWARPAAPAESELQALLRAEGLDFHAWSNNPYDVYAPHLHDYNKVLYCVRGSITFELVKLGAWYKLSPGDRLDLPAGVLHAAAVGKDGVACLEAWR